MVLIAYSAFAVGPILITLFASLKSEPSFFSAPASFPTHFYFANYTQAWAQGDLLPAFLNSVLVTVGLGGGQRARRRHGRLRRRPVT